MVRKNRRKNKQEHEDDWPPPNLKNFSTDPEPYRKRDGTEVYLKPKNRPVVLKIRKPSVEELLGIKKPEE